MSRRERTERQILDAVQAQIDANGMNSVGINAIAKRAGVSKELIYRYFNGMPGLMLTWMQEQDFWAQPPALPQEGEPRPQAPGDVILSVLRAQIDALQNNPTLREIHRWELIETNDLTAAFNERRDPAAREFVERLRTLGPQTDLPAMTSLLLAGVLYLMLRSKTDSHFLDVPLRTEAGWQRIDAALTQLLSHTPPGSTDSTTPTPATPPMS